MSDIQYKIKNNITGKYFKSFNWTHGLRKDGKPRKTGFLKLEVLFSTFEEAYFRDIEQLNIEVWRAVYNNQTDLFDNCEVVAYTMQPTKTNVRLATMRNRTEAKVIMAKLKA